MIHKIFYLEAKETDPYHNLAVEETLFDTVSPGTCILYLWQNQKTVVIGRNQNCWKECRVEKLEEEGGHLARRLSGGGAVFHDLGNLNFTFLTAKDDFSVERQLEVIKRAAAGFGLNVEKTGRNDLTIQGKKFSGNAFYEAGGKSYHHGTLLICSDEKQVARFLNVDPLKLQAKGVDSVRSRIGNLGDYCPSVTVEAMRRNLLYAYSLIYGLCPQRISEEDLPQVKIQELEEKYRSWEWKYGRKIPFTHRFARRFSWGDFELQMEVNGGMIQEEKIYSDGMDSRFSLLEGCLRGMKYERQTVAQALREEMERKGIRREESEDILAFIWEEMS